MSCDSYVRTAITALAPQHAERLLAVYDQPTRLRPGESASALRAEATLLLARLRQQGLTPPPHLNPNAARGTAYVRWGRLGAALRAIRGEEGAPLPPPIFTSFDELLRRAIVVEGAWLTTLTPDNPEALEGAAFRTVTQAAGQIGALEAAGVAVPEDVAAAACTLRDVAAVPATSRRDRAALLAAADTLAMLLVEAGERAGVFDALMVRPRTRKPVIERGQVWKAVAGYLGRGQPASMLVWGWAREALRHAGRFEGGEHLGLLADTLTPETWQEARLQAARRKSASQPYSAAWYTARGASVALHSAALAAAAEAKRDTVEATDEEARERYARRIVDDAVWCYQHAVEAAWAVGGDQRFIEQAAAAMAAPAGGVA